MAIDKKAVSNQMQILKNHAGIKDPKEYMASIIPILDGFVAEYNLPKDPEGMMATIINNGYDLSEVILSRAPWGEKARKSIKQEEEKKEESKRREQERKYDRNYDYQTNFIKFAEENGIDPLYQTHYPNGLSERTHLEPYELRILMQKQGIDYAPFHNKFDTEYKQREEQRKNLPKDRFEEHAQKYGVSYQTAVDRLSGADPYGDDKPRRY